jgi:DNA-directed RNA polymerase subunit K/omega
MLSPTHDHTARNSQALPDLQQPRAQEHDLVEWLPLTLFESTQIIVVRAEQISKGAEALVRVPEGVTSALDIAELEVSSGALDHWTIDRRGTKVRIGSIRYE